MEQKQSEVLTAFYRAYLDFAEGKQVIYFTKRCGLCHNLSRFLNSTGQKHKYYEIMLEMQYQFVAARLDYNYPFNNGSEDDYQKEKEEQNMIANQNRLDWVRSHAQ